MKLANLDNILNIFTKSDEEVVKEELAETNDLYNFNKGIRGVYNYRFLNEIASNRRPDVYPRIKEAVKKSYFDKMFGYIANSDYSNKKIIDSTLAELGYEVVLECINQLLDHFVELEEYEKCAILRDVNDMFNSQIKKKVK